MRVASSVLVVMLLSHCGISQAAEPAELAELRATDARLAQVYSHPERMRVRQQIAELALPPALPSSPDAILAQQFPGFAPSAGFGQPQSQTAQRAPAQDLIDVVQDTIAPNSWDIRGGQGVVRYWPRGHALVVRQTGNHQNALGDLIRDLHR